MVGEVVTELHSRVCPNWTADPRVWTITRRDCPSCGGGWSGLGTMIRHHAEWCEYLPPAGQGGQADRQKEKPIDGYEYDWISTKWRRMISSFGKAGRGKYIKQRLSRRARRRSNMEKYDDC